MVRLYGSDLIAVAVMVLLVDNHHSSAPVGDRICPLVSLSNVVSIVDANLGVVDSFPAIRELVFGALAGAFGFCITIHRV